MSEDNIRKLTFDEEFLLEGAEKRYDEGDFFGALKMLNKRGEMYDPSADASALYAAVYEALGLWHLCVDAWFRFLDTCNEADFSEGYEGLSYAFLNLGDSFQSELYLRHIYGEDMPEPEEMRPPLRLVHSADGGAEDSEYLFRGIECIKQGDLSGAREALTEISPESKDYPSASGLTAMCLLLEGDTEGAASECARLLEFYPDNVHALTTYCAVLGAKGDTDGAREVGKRLAEIETDSAEDLFRVATALCETGLDEAAYEKLTVLKKKTPYSDDTLWFHAVAAYRTGRTQEAIDSLDRLTTVYPRKAVAKYYLVRLRELLDGTEKPFAMNYFYRLPDEEYKNIVSFFLAASRAKRSDVEQFAELSVIGDYFRLAFDQLDGRDEKLQMLAGDVAVKCRCDALVREVLLDYNVSESIKLAMLSELIRRNEENSYGVVMCSLYREFFTHKIHIGNRKRTSFMQSFTEVYVKYAMIGEENEEKIIAAAESIYRTLEEAEALDYADETEAMAAVIYREARMKDSDHSIEAVAKHFDANLSVIKEILNYII